MAVKIVSVLPTGSRKSVCRLWHAACGPFLIWKGLGVGLGGGFFPPPNAINCMDLFCSVALGRCAPFFGAHRMGDYCIGFPEFQEGQLLFLFTI